MMESLRAQMAGWRSRLTRPLTPEEARRIRIHLALLPVYIWLVIEWSALAFDLGPAGRLDRQGHIKGHDFVHFYSLARIGLERAGADLYSFDAFITRTQQVVPGYAEARYLPVHGPQVAIFFAPLGALSYETALAVWLLISAAVYATSCYLLWRALPRLRPFSNIVIACAAAWPAFYSLVAAGQVSSVSLLWFTLGYLALERRREWVAGLCLGALVYKPTLGLVLPFAFLATRHWRVIGGALISSGVQFGAAAAYFGWSVVLQYLANFRSAISSIDLLEARPGMMHSLRSFFSILLPWPDVAAALYFVTAALVIVLAVRVWRSTAPLERRFAVLLIATALVSPHVYSYELVILLPAFLFTVNDGIERGRESWPVWTLLYCVYAMPALEPLTLQTRLQLSVPALVLWMLFLARWPSASPSRSRT